MVSTHISSKGLIWQLGGEDYVIKEDYIIVTMPTQLHQYQYQPIVNANTNKTTFIKSLIHFLKYILYNLII